jgi:dephospho-CoA kinase
LGKGKKAIMKLKDKYIKLNSENRLHSLSIPIIGLTGGIATGKSTVARVLRSKGLSILDADELVKNIYAKDETKSFIKQKFPQAFKQDSIHFPSLREIFFKDSKAKEEIESFIYQRLPDAFLNALKGLGNPSFIIYDVPLLFEKKLKALVDLAVVVYAPRNVQRARLMKRDGILDEMAQNILNHQEDIEDKKLKADFIIDNSKSESELNEEIEQFLRKILY